MAVCPVCEHVQEGGGECAVCGRLLAHAPAQVQPSERLADLVPTRLEVGAFPGAARMADLEPTRHEAAAAAAEEVPAWIERTSLPPEGTSRDLLALPACRYCRTPASPEDVFCARCGLKLAVHSREPPTPAAGVRRCRFCGAEGAGDACPACGGRLAVEE